MERLDLYNIDLKALVSEVYDFEYILDNNFFELINGDEIKKGSLRVNLKIKNSLDRFIFDFQIKGSITIPCDRCLEDMVLPIENENHLIVKFGESDYDIDDELIVINGNKGIINVAWYIYEFIALDIPIKHIHAEGECDDVIIRKLEEHSVNSVGSIVDDRWDALKNIRIENDNN